MKNFLNYSYVAGSVQKVSGHVIRKIETFIEKDTRYKKHCTQDNDASVSFNVGTLGSHTVLPMAISFSVVFPESHQQSEIYSLSKVILVLGKARSHRALGGLSHLVDLVLCQKLSMRYDGWVGALPWWSCQSPVAHSCSLLNHPNRFCRGMLKLHTKFDADLSIYLLSHFECDALTVHMFTQKCLPSPLTSTVKSSLFTDVHYSPLSLAARSHQCCTSCCHFINNGSTFSMQTLYVGTVNYKKPNKQLGGETVQDETCFRGLSRLKKAIKLREQ